jgi:hypothetical protein
MNFYTDVIVQKYVLVTLNGDILDTAHCENGG